MNYQLVKKNVVRGVKTMDEDEEIDMAWLEGICGDYAEDIMEWHKSKLKEAKNGNEKR